MFEIDFWDQRVHMSIIFLGVCERIAKGPIYLAVTDLQKFLISFLYLCAFWVHLHSQEDIRDSLMETLLMPSNS